MSQSLRAVYLGTFDPLTNGHFDIIERGAFLFEHLVIGIGQNSKKTPFFSLDERLEMLKQACSLLENVSITTFNGLAVEFARSCSATVMLRGLRTEADYVYEMQMAMMNRVLEEKIETVFIPTRQDLSHISSSLVKDVAQLGGDVSCLVPKNVYQRLRQKLTDSL